MEHELILSILALALFGWFVHLNMQARETALRAATLACRGQGLQLLDATVALHRLRPSLDRDRGCLILRRVYRFEFSADRERRRQGFIFLHGGRVENIVLAACRTEDEAAANAGERSIFP
jgi:hypothetical protein